jgi:hypothetical protein
MIAEDHVQNIETLEAFTLYSLDRSQEGLATLVRETRRCGKALQGGLQALPGELTRIKTLAGQLHDFNVFELNLSCLFQLDRARFADDNGSFETATTNFRQALEEFKTRMAFNDLAGSGRVLSENIGGALARIQALIPLIRDWINREFGETAASASPAPGACLAEQEAPTIT